MYRASSDENASAVPEFRRRPTILTVWVAISPIALFGFCVEKFQYVWTLRMTDGILYFNVIFSIISIEQNMNYL